MANITKQKRDEMLAFLEMLKKEHSDDASIRAFNEIENHLREKKFGLVFEEHTEEVNELLQDNIPVLCADPERRICKDESLPWNFIIEGDNLQALYLLEKTHRGKVDCIYIDPPYNSGATDWKYNNDYVEKEDAYRHSKWLSMMEIRLLLAKKLLNPKGSVLICTIDEREYLHLGCLLEELFPDSKMQMVSTNINPKGSARDGFSRSDEYIFFIMIGDCSPSRLPLTNEWSSSAIVSGQTTAKSYDAQEPGWTSMMRRGTDSLRVDTPNLYYPIYVDPSTKRIVEIGEAVPEGRDRAKEIEGLVQILPIRRNGAQGRWQVGAAELESRIEQGRVRLGKPTSYGYVVNYLPDGEYKKILNGEFSVSGYAEDGSLLAYRHSSIEELRMPPTQWKISTHNASENGTSFLTGIIGEKRFAFPKSIYAVRDTLRFFVADKPDAIILDFFAGSGTTQHAVNLLNAVDGGHRRCIMVTNNEISADEERKLTDVGIHKGDDEWENLGIARYVTWPRTLCSVMGQNIQGKPLAGDYGVETDAFEPSEDIALVSKSTGKPLRRNVYIKTKKQLYPELAKIQKSDGFACNVKYFKCDWTPRKPEDYLLSNVLCLHIREMIELQNHIEVDNIKNILILNKEDLKKFILAPDNYAKAENIWVNQNIILSAKELKLLQAKGFKYIPREFFGQELREAAE